MGGLTIEGDLFSAVQRVLLSNKVNYWTGQECREFEKEFATWAEANYALALANGTLALDAILKAMKIGPGDEVIVTPRTFIASVSCVVNAGATPVFADVDVQSGNLSAETISRMITPKTRAVICVHLGGWPCDMDPIMELAAQYNFKVIEDCAQAHGARYKGRSVGSIGHAAAAGIPGIFARWLRGKPFVFEVRDLWPELPKAMGVIRNPLILGAMSMLEWLSYRSAHRLVGLSPGIVDGISAIGVSRERISLVPNGCDLEIFAGTVSPWRPPEIGSSDLMAVFAGTHGVANGLDAVLDAAAELHRRKRDDIKLLGKPCGQVDWSRGKFQSILLELPPSGAGYVLRRGDLASPFESFSLFHAMAEERVNCNRMATQYGESLQRRWTERGSQ